MGVRILSIVLPLLGMPTGEIYGDIRVGETYIAGAPVQLKCGDEIVNGTTDKAGSFRLTAKATGKCIVSVTYEKATPSVEVVLFEKPSRYRLVLEKKDASYILKRV